MGKKPHKVDKNKPPAARFGRHGQGFDKRTYKGAHTRRGRPRKSELRNVQLRVRLNAAEVEVVDSMREESSRSRPEFIRWLIQKQAKRFRKSLVAGGDYEKAIQLVEQRIPREYMLDMLAVCPLEWAPERMIKEVLERGLQSVLNDRGVRQRPLVQRKRPDRSFYDRASMGEGG